MKNKIILAATAGLLACSSDMTAAAERIIRVTRDLHDNPPVQPVVLVLPEDLAAEVEQCPPLREALLRIQDDIIWEEALANLRALAATVQRVQVAQADPFEELRQLYAAMSVRETFLPAAPRRQFAVPRAQGRPVAAQGRHRQHRTQHR